ncbi:MAG: hypothetical protein ACLP9L_12520 [Thermoguttaceae bacterium]
MNKVAIVPPMSNREFLEKYAQPGRVGLAGGSGMIDKTIRQAERLIDQELQPSQWSHAFLFEGRRADGQHWVIESDLEIHSKHIRLGVQENRITKFLDEKCYPCLAVLDFCLTPEQTTALLGEGLEMVASHVRYSIRELAGTFVRLRRPELRAQDNPLSRKKSLFCSAFVTLVFRKIAVDLAPGLNEKHTTPEDISRTPVPHETFLLRRDITTPSMREKIQQLYRDAKEQHNERLEKVKAVLTARNITAAPRPDRSRRHS